MPTIKFVRVERDCPANKDRRADGFNTGIIYDFDVMIDGEKRAEMQRQYTGKGYNVQDADGRPVDPPLPHYRTGREVGSKAEFLTIVSELLEAGKIPTIARMAELRAEAEAALDVRRAEVAARYRTARIESAGVQLYEALKPLIEYMRNNGGDEAYHDADGTGWLSRAEAAFAEAEKTYPTDAEQIEYEAKHR
jgi:hypothetical protein